MKRAGILNSNAKDENAPERNLPCRLRLSHHRIPRSLFYLGFSTIILIDEANYVVAWRRSEARGASLARSFSLVTFVATPLKIVYRLENVFVWYIKNWHIFPFITSIGLVLRRTFFFSPFCTCKRPTRGRSSGTVSDSIERNVHEIFLPIAKGCARRLLGFCEKSNVVDSCYIFTRKYLLYVGSRYLDSF